jgi:hypothetical protein
MKDGLIDARFLFASSFFALLATASVDVVLMAPSFLQKIDVFAQLAALTLPIVAG